MAQYTQYLSTDTGAPYITGLSGSLITTLDKILVTGYGTKPGAGWSKPLSSGSYFAVYKMPTGSTEHYLRVIDNNDVTGQVALLKGFATMSNVITGSEAFPSDVQATWTTSPFKSLGLRKSLTTGSVIGANVSRSWVAFADSRSMMLFIDTGDAAGVYQPMYFGEIYSFKPNDSYRTILIADEDDAGSRTTSDFGTLSTLANADVNGHYMVRSYTGLTGSIAMSKIGCRSLQGETADNYYNFFAGQVPFPNGPDGGIYLLPPVLVEPLTLNVRGVLRGVYIPVHPPSSLPDTTTFSGSGDFAGKIFTSVRTVRGAAASDLGTVVIEISDTLLTN